MRNGGVRMKVIVAGAAIALLTAGACSSDDTTSEPSASATASEDRDINVEVILTEFAVSAPVSAAAGSLTFAVTNDGPEDVHEFVIIRTDLSSIDLPIDADGAVVEGGAGMEAVDEIEDIAVGDTQTLTVDLEAGSYVFICNILQTEPDGSLEAHYAEGMRTGFTVE